MMSESVHTAAIQSEFAKQQMKVLVENRAVYERCLYPTGRCLAEKSGPRALQHPSIHYCIWVAVQPGSGTKCAMHLDMEGWRQQ